MWAIPPTWFLMLAVPVIVMLTFALYSTLRSLKADDAEWERQRRRLHSLNRPIFPPRNAQMIVGAATATWFGTASAYGDAPIFKPGAMWPVNHHRDVERISFYG